MEAGAGGASSARQTAAPLPLTMTVLNVEAVGRTPDPGSSISWKHTSASSQCPTCGRAGAPGRAGEGVEAPPSQQIRPRQAQHSVPIDVAANPAPNHAPPQHLFSSPHTTCLDQARDVGVHAVGAHVRVGTAQPLSNLQQRAVAGAVGGGGDEAVEGRHTGPHAPAGGTPTLRSAPTNAQVLCFPGCPSSSTSLPSTLCSHTLLPLTCGPSPGTPPWRAPPAAGGRQYTAGGWVWVGWGTCRRRREISGHRPLAPISASRPPPPSSCPLAPDTDLEGVGTGLDDGVVGDPIRGQSGASRPHGR